MHERLDVHTSNHASCPYMHEHWLLHEHIMSDTYKDEYIFFKTKFWIRLHAYLSTIWVHIWTFGQHW